VKLDFDEPAERVNVTLNFAGEKKDPPAKPIL